MTRKAARNPVDVAVALAAGGGAALVLGVALSAIATPHDFQSRTAALGERATRAESLLRPVRDRGAFGVEALCTRDAIEQAKQLHEVVTSEATNAGLVIDSLETRLEPAPEISERVMPVRLRVSVTGSYEAAVGLAALLSRERPQVFVDSLDLVPKVSNVTLSLSGRVYCGA
jgi:hypothetical protein